MGVVAEYFAARKQNGVHRAILMVVMGLVNFTTHNVIVSRDLCNLVRSEKSGLVVLLVRMLVGQTTSQP